jgi:hypothetical protein
MTIVLRRKGCLFSVLFSEWFRTITSKREKDKNYYGVRLKENAKNHWERKRDSLRHEIKN